MFKRLFKKINKRRDIRFLDAESYKYQQTTKSSGPSRYVEDKFIRVEKVNTPSFFGEFERFDSGSFLELIRQATAYNELLDDQNAAQEPSRLVTSTTSCKRHLNSLGVFSDSKIYSALIHSVLSKHNLDIQHFNHPETFKQNKYSCFDSITSWIIFLSEDQESDFLDKFLDRYVEKPTLFLFSKLNKDACMNRIEQFIELNNLEALESDQELAEAVLVNR